MRLQIPSKRAYKDFVVQAKKNMVYDVVIRRPAAPTFNQNTGMMTGASASTVYTGKARIYTESGALTQLGEAAVVVNQTIISIPIDAPLPRVDDQAAVTAGPDSKLIGRVFRIVDVAYGGHSPAFRQLVVTGIEPDAFFTYGSSG